MIPDFRTATTEELLSAANRASAHVEEYQQAHKCGVLSFYVEKLVEERDRLIAMNGGKSCTSEKSSIVT